MEISEYQFGKIFEIIFYTTLDLITSGVIINKSTIRSKIISKLKENNFNKDEEMIAAGEILALIECDELFELAIKMREIKKQTQN